MQESSTPSPEQTATQGNSTHNPKLDSDLQTAGLQPEGRANTPLVLSVIALVAVLVIGVIALPKLLAPVAPSVTVTAPSSDTALQATATEGSSITAGDASLIGDDILAVGSNGAVLRLDKAQFESMLENYILNNGDVVIQAVQNFQVEEQKLAQEQQKQALASIKDDLLNNPNAPILGNPDGDITVVEFLDYNCGYCKRAYSMVQGLIKADPNVRVLIKELPILSPSSKTAALVALAANRLGRYYDVHQAFLQYDKGLTRDSIQEIIEGLSLDWEEIETLSNDPALRTILEENDTFAEILNIRGTPGFIVGDQIIPGALSLAEMQRLIAEERARIGENSEGQVQATQEQSEQDPDTDIQVENTADNVPVSETNLKEGIEGEGTISPETESDDNTDSAPETL